MLVEHGRIDAQRVERAFCWPVAVAALLVIPVMVIEQSALDDPWTRLAKLANAAIWLVFAAELVAILVVLPTGRERVRWLREHPLEVAIVALTPPFVPSRFQAVRLLRLVRLVWAVRFLRQALSLTGLRWAAILTVLAALGGGAAYQAAEEGEFPWGGAWWAAQTMMTLGTAEEAKTDAGRAITIAVTLIGIGFIALVTGAVAQRFVAKEVDEVTAAESEVVDELRRIRQRLFDLEAQLARRYER